MTTTTRPGRRVTPTAHLVLPATADRDDWLKVRRLGIGSSDIPAVMGVSTQRTARHVYHDKRGDLPADEDAGEAALWGTLHEETVAREWARRNRSVVRRVGVVARADAPWQMCTLDRRVRECPLNREQLEACALEVKTRSAFVASKWRRGVPDDVLAQTLWQIHVTGYEHIHTACLIGGNDYRQYVVRRAGNEDLIADIVTVATRLQNDITAGRVPAWTGDESPDAVLDLYERLHPDRDGVVHLDEDLEVVNDLREYEEHRLAEAAARKAKEAAKARLVARLGGAEYAALDNDLAYSYKESSRRSPDLDRLAECWPEAYADCVPDKGSRRITIAKPYRLKEPT